MIEKGIEINSIETGNMGIFSISQNRIDYSTAPIALQLWEPNNIGNIFSKKSTRVNK